jgi:hypothetical protein
MWSLTTSKGVRVDGIQREQDARGAVHLLGVAEVIGPYSWRVIDNHGQRFVAELRRSFSAPELALAAA